MKNGTYIVLGVMMLLMLAAMLPAISGRYTIDPDLSSVDLTAENMAGCTTCPSGDGPVYENIKITCIDPSGAPIEGISAEHFEFILTDQGCIWYGTLGCTFTPVTAATDSNGELKFSIVGDTSIVGDLGIQVNVAGITINDLDIIECRSPDYICDGDVDLGDFTLFGQDWGNPAPRSDFDWDGGSTDLGDFTLFGQHWGH